jgi:hypothetical protein
VFVVGGWVLLCVATAASIRLLAATYERFDPSQDMPA